MIIVMKTGATQNDVDYVVGRANSLGLETHLSHDGAQTLISLLGNLQTLNPAALAGLRGVKKIVPTMSPYRLVSREFKSENSTITLPGLSIGSNQVIVMAGPCAVESRDQLMKTAWAV